MPDAADEPKGELMLRTVALPKDANPSGDVFGGWTVSQMDLAAGSFSADHAAGRVATISTPNERSQRPSHFQFAGCSLEPGPTI